MTTSRSRRSLMVSMTSTVLRPSRSIPTNPRASPGPRVVQQGGQTRTLLPGRRPGQAAVSARYR
jgi:hypothetical protein